MKIPVPPELQKALDDTTKSMVDFGKKLDRVIELLEEIARNTKA